MTLPTTIVYDIARRYGMRVHATQRDVMQRAHQIVVFAKTPTRTLAISETALEDARDPLAVIRHLLEREAPYVRADAVLAFLDEHRPPSSPFAFDDHITQDWWQRQERAGARLIEEGERLMLALKR